MLSTLCTSINCFKCAYFSNGVCFTFISVDSGVVFTVDCAEGLRTSHAVNSLLLLFHFHPQVLLTEVSYLPCSSGTAAFSFSVGLFFWVCPVLGFNLYSIVDELNVLSSSGVTCALSRQLITAGGVDNRGRMRWITSHFCFS